MLFCAVDFHKSNLTDIVPSNWLVIFDDDVRFQNVIKSGKFPPPSLWTAFFCLLAHRFTDCSKRFVIYMLRNQWHNWLCYISVIQSQIVKAFLNRLSKSKISVRDKLLKLAKWLKTFVIDAYKVEWPMRQSAITWRQLHQRVSLCCNSWQRTKSWNKALWCYCHITPAASCLTRSWSADSWRQQINFFSQRVLHEVLSFIGSDLNRVEWFLFRLQWRWNICEMHIKLQQTCRLLGWICFGEFLFSALGHVPSNNPLMRHNCRMQMFRDRRLNHVLWSMRRNLGWGCM